MADKPLAAPEQPEPFTIPSLGTVLITGGCGFLGSHVVTLLRDRSVGSAGKIHVLDIRPPKTPLKGATYHTADITASTSLAEVFKTIKPEVVIHTASPVYSSGGDRKTRDFMWAVNVDGTQNLLTAAREAGVKAFVYTSSGSVIHDSVSDLVNADERWPLVRGRSQPEYYSTTKAEAESLVLAASTRSPTPFLTTALRPSGIFGEGDVQFVPNLLRIARDGQTKFQIGDNDNIWDFTYVGNVAQAHLQAAAKLLETYREIEGGKASSTEEDHSRADGEAFSITNQAPVYFWDFSRAIWSTYYRLSPQSMSKPPATPKQTIAIPVWLMVSVMTVVVKVKSLLGLDPPTLLPGKLLLSACHRYYRTRKAEAVLGYVPEVMLDDAVERTVKWFVEQERS